MKKLLIAFFVLFSAVASAQKFTEINNYQAPIGLAVKNYFSIPSGSTPTFGNVSRRDSGALFWRTTDSSLYAWSGYQWVVVAGSGGGGTGCSLDSITVNGDRSQYVVWTSCGTKYFPTLLQYVRGEPPIVFTPAANAGDTGVISCPTCPKFGNGLTDGGIVSHDTLYRYNVTTATYVIGGIQYTAPQILVTLAAADATFDRVDIITADTSGHIIVLTGTPAANPAWPNIDPTTQLTQPLSVITVKAGTTTPPGVTHLPVWDENLNTPTEWAPAPSAGYAPNFNNTTGGTVAHGVKSIDFPSYTVNRSVTFTAAATTDRNSWTLLTMNIKLKAPLASASAVRVWFSNGTTNVTTALTLTTAHGFDKASSAYQNISIPLSGLSFTSNTFNRVNFLVTGTGGGLYLDYVQLQGGIATGNTDFVQNVLKRNDSLFQFKGGVPLFVGTVTGSGKDSTAYHTINILSDTSYAICDLKGRCDTFLLTGGGSGGGPLTLQQVTNYGNTTTRAIRASVFEVTERIGFNLDSVGKMISTGYGSNIFFDKATGKLLLQSSTNSASAGGSPIYAQGTLYVNPNGSISFGNYGFGLFPGTAVKNLAVDASGNMIEVATSSGPTPPNSIKKYLNGYNQFVTLDADSITNAVTLTGSQTVTNKILTSPRLNTSSTTGYVWTASDNLGNGAWAAAAGGGLTPPNTIKKYLNGYNQFVTLDADSIANAVTLIGTQTLTNKTLTSPVINLGTNATGDIYYRNGSGLFTRLPIGTASQTLHVVSGLPAWRDTSAGATVAGNANELQFNNGSGGFGASANVYYNAATSGVRFGGTSGIFIENDAGNRNIRSLGSMNFIINAAQTGLFDANYFGWDNEVRVDNQTGIGYIGMTRNGTPTIGTSNINEFYSYPTRNDAPTHLVLRGRDYSFGGQFWTPNVYIFPTKNTTNNDVGSIILGHNGTSRQGNVGIGTGSPDIGAILDISDTLRGFVLPRMTTAQRNDILRPIASYTVTSGGSGYGLSGTATVSTGVVTAQIETPQLQFNAGVLLSIATGTFNGKYKPSAPPTVTIGGPGTGATATATLAPLPAGMEIFNTTTGCKEVWNGVAWTAQPQSGVTTISGTYAALVTDNIINVTANSFTITLPSPVGLNKPFTIKNSGSGAVIVASGSNIDGSPSYTLGSQYKYVSVQPSGSTYIVIANN